MILKSVSTTTYKPCVVESDVTAEESVEVVASSDDDE